jgi:23S rRNA (uridine2552-2'-O)-methyltransferase
VARRFVAERRRDPFFRAAQREGLRSRAAFKLSHLAQRFPIFRRGDRVLDLGAAPGGWSLVASEIVGPHGEVVAVDPRSFDPIPGVTPIRGRVGEVGLDRRLGPEPFDVVLSDMSPSISGAYATDHARSVTLVRAALTLARNHLKPGGSFVAKAFDGDLLPELDGEAEPLFARWRHTKPPASRSTSSETYLIGLGFRGPASPEPFARPASKDLR